MLKIIHIVGVIHDSLKITFIIPYAQGDFMALLHDLLHYLITAYCRGYRQTAQCLWSSR